MAFEGIASQVESCHASRDSRNGGDACRRIYQARAEEAWHRRIAAVRSEAGVL